MRVVVCGSRHFVGVSRVLHALETAGATEVAHGAAAGADYCAHIAAERLGIPVTRYPADWTRYGRRAGPIRNQEMLDSFRPDLVLAFPTKASRGTWDLVRRARVLGIRVEVNE